MNVLFTGASGFIGQHMVRSLLENKCRVSVLARKPLKPQPGIEVINTLAELHKDRVFDCLINLAGSPIDCLWSKSGKQRLYDSRLGPTKDLITLIKRLEQAPGLLISASAVGYYGNEPNTTFSEDSQPCDGFTHQLCQAWEETAMQAQDLGVRVCLARLGVVLGSDGGFIKKVSLPFQLGLGGTLGHGQQSFPWIHIHDVIRAFWHFINNHPCQGAYNLVSSQIINNQTLTHSLGKALNRPTLLPLPSLLIRCLFGEMGETLLLSGSAISADKLLQSGFSFEYTNIEAALQQVCAPQR